MAIDRERFIAWAEDTFGEGAVRLTPGGEVRINSPFDPDDFKGHCWCNVEGGRNERENGVFHCYKTDRIGSLITLVADADKCSPEEAFEKIGSGEARIAEIDDAIALMLSGKEPAPRRVQPKAGPVSLPPDSAYLVDLPRDDPHRISAEKYLAGRHLKVGRKAVCWGGKYHNRLIIPFFGRDGRLAFFKARDILENPPEDRLRYLAPTQEEGFVASDQVYMPEWPSLGSLVQVVEGELDADSLHESGIWACGLGGKSISEMQAMSLRGYRLCLGLDNDSSGGAGTLSVAKEADRFGLRVQSYVRPPEQFKDWNKLLVERGPVTVRTYVRAKRKPFDLDQMLMFAEADAMTASAGGGGRRALGL